MSETIAETIIPGTYIEVRAEGLIAVGGISTGAIGVVGTANRGPLNEVVILGSYQEALDTFGAYDRWVDPVPQGQDPPLSLTRTLEQVFKGGGSTVHAVRVSTVAANTMRRMTWTVVRNDTALFTLTATSPGTWANAVTTRLQAPAGQPATLELELGRLKETFSGANAGVLARAVNETSRLVTASAPSETNAGLVPTAVNPAAEDARGGPDGVGVTATEIAQGFAALARQSVNLVVAGGLHAGVIGGTMLAHLEATESDDRERIGIVGAASDDLNAIATNASALSNRRLVLVAPGVLADDAARVGEPNKQVRLPPAYAAALIAGRLSTVAPHISLTNKDVAADGLTTEYTRAQQKQLLANRVLALHKQLGIRVLKAITTDDGPFRQISVRRIVDFAKEGVRRGANPYIGRLNNARVRAALKATLDGFLSQMVVDEMLIDYELDVSASRSQEIAGIAAVTMTLRPTFSIDFIRVTMNLE